MTLQWYRQDREAVLAALARGERPDMATTLSAGVVDELVALHEELGVLAALGAVPTTRTRKGVPDTLLLRTRSTLPFVDRVRAIAAARGCTPGQLALAWLIAQGQDIVPIPGTKRRAYLEENVAALGVTLLPDELRQINEAAPQGAAAGTRYPAHSLSAVNR